MAQFTRTNGDYLPVINYDSPAYTNSGVNAVTSGATVQPQGPKLDFFTITFDAALTTTQLNTAVQTIQQLWTQQLQRLVLQLQLPLLQHSQVNF